LITHIELNTYNIFLAPLILTPHSSVLSTTPVDDPHMKPKQQLVKKAQFLPEETEPLNMSSSTTPDEENQSNKIPVQSIIKGTSSSNESTPNIAPGNTDVSEVNDNLFIQILVPFDYFLKHSPIKYNKSKENSSIHSSFQSEQRFIVSNITQ